MCTKSIQNSLLLLTGNTVPMLGHSICLRCRPHCSHPGDEMQRSHSEGKENCVLELRSSKKKKSDHSGSTRHHTQENTRLSVCLTDCFLRFSCGRKSRSPVSVTAAIMCLWFVARRRNDRFPAVHCSWRSYEKASCSSGVLATTASKTQQKPLKCLSACACLFSRSLSHTFSSWK